jgi:hypothetical protein
MERVDPPSTDSKTHWFLQRYLLGHRSTVAGTVYGTIVVLSVLAAGAKAYEHHLWQLAAIAGISSFVLWVAHVYSHGLGESLTAGRRLTVSEVVAIARREYSIMLAAVPPLMAVVLGAVGILPEHTAVRWALGVGVVTLTAQGVRYARMEHLGRFATMTTVSLNLAIGLTLVAVEAWVAH